MTDTGQPGGSLTPAARRATAYHEAGHAVAAICRQVRFAYVTIEPDAQSGSAGHVQFKGNSTKGVASLYARAVVALADEAAQRRFSLRSLRLHHGGGDRETVADLARRATGSSEQADLLVKFWTVCARDLVASRWEAVNQVAAGLLDRKRLTYAEVLSLALTRSTSVEWQTSDTLDDGLTTHSATD